MSIAIAIVIVAPGCVTTHHPQTPASTADAYMDSLRRGDQTAARSLRVSSDAGLEADEAALVNGSEPGKIRELDRTARWSSAETFILARSQGESGWLIRGGVLTSFSALSPEACLDRLSKAISTRDPRLLKTLLPADLDATLGLGDLEAVLLRPRWLALAATLSAGARKWVSRGAERAELEVVVEGEPHTLVLVREGLVWKVFDVRPWKGYLPR